MAIATVQVQRLPLGRKSTSNGHGVDGGDMREIYRFRLGEMNLNGQVGDALPVFSLHKLRWLWGCDAGGDGRTLCPHCI